MRDIVEVCFREGSTKMFWKESFLETDFKQGEFVQKKFRKFIVSKKPIPHHDGPRGLNSQKQKDIVEKLGPIIPKEKLQFWIDMPIKDSSIDLTLNLQG